MCFFGSSLMGAKTHINKIPPPKSRGQSSENFVYVFFLYAFFSLPKIVFLRPRSTKTRKLNGYLAFEGFGALCERAVMSFGKAPIAPLSHG